ncbi:MAG: F0F1 ATP synthase subunit delta [bacterium]
MKYSPTHYAAALIATTAQAKEEDLMNILKRFHKILIKRRAIRQLPLIIAAYERLQREKSGRIAVSLATARAIDLDVLTRELESALGKSVELYHELRPELLGGAVVTVKDTRIDASLSTMLEQLRHTLAHSINN